MRQRDDRVDRPACRSLAIAAFAASIGGAYRTQGFLFASMVTADQADAQLPRRRRPTRHDRRWHGPGETAAASRR